MKITLNIDETNKTVVAVKDRVTGKRFSLLLADELFALEDKGYVVSSGNKMIAQKLDNFRIAFYRKK